jgi:aminoacyl tRNA synthase complex-interacting multifunctional protein 1
MDELNDLIAELEVAVASSSSSASASEGNAGKGGKAQKDKPPKAPKGGKGGDAKPPAQADAITVNSLDLRVGIIRKVARHETAEKLYVEEIDVGEEVPRPIASGLVPYYSLEEMQDRKLIVVCNLKPRNLVGFKSHGMVLCASKTGEDGSNIVEFVAPPEGSQPGDRVVGEGLTGEPFSMSQCDKKKVWEIVAADLRVDAEGVAQWGETRLLCVSADGSGPLTTPTVRDAHVA